MAELVLRCARSKEDVVHIAEAIARQFAAPLSPREHLDHPLERFPADRTLMLAVEDGDTVVAGAIALRTRAGATLREIGVDAGYRGRGLGRVLIEAIELEAMALGVMAIHLGSADEARGFYERLGYRGKHTMRMKELPPPGVVRTRRLAAWHQRGALDEGIVVAPDRVIEADELTSS